MAIRGASLGGAWLALTLSVPALSAPLSQEDAVRYFLGVQARSPVTVEAIESTPDGVTVKGLNAPLGAASDAARLHVDLVQITGIATGETTATFGSILGTGVSIDGPSGLTARSLMLTDVSAKDLGVKPLSIAALDNLLLGDVVIADQARLESYSVSMSGKLQETFSGTVKIQGIQTAAAAAASPVLGDRFDVSLSFRGDAAARTFDTTYSASQSLIGLVEGEAHWSDVTFRAGAISPLSQFDLLATLQDAKLVSGTVNLKPGPNGRMLLRALPPNKREEVATLGRTLVERDGSVPPTAAASIGETLVAFINRPDKLSLSVSPPAPVAMNASFAGATTQSLIDRFGLKLSQGEASASK
jgi:hypothetical protein